MEYIILNASPTSSVRTSAEDNTKFECDYSISVGIKGDPHGLCAGDGCTVTWDKSLPGDQAESNVIPAQLQEYVNNKYTG